MQSSEGHLVIEGSDARHLAVVRRARPGDRIQVGDGQGLLAEAAIESISGDIVHAVVVEKRLVSPPAPSITVLQGLAREFRMEIALQKLVEIGVDCIVVFGVSRSLPRWDEIKRVKIARRWESICYEASKQSRRPWLPRLDGPVDLETAAHLAAEHALCLVADPSADITLKDVLPSRAPESVAVVVGPEGGLEREEVRRFSKDGGVPVSIGEQILRTETAGIAISSALMFHFGRLG